MSYLIAQTDENSQVFIVRVSDGARIPQDELNMDYQDYLAWVAEGNTPEPWENTNGPE